MELKDLLKAGGFKQTGKKTLLIERLVMKRNDPEFDYVTLSFMILMNSKVFWKDANNAFFIITLLPKV